MIFGINLDMCLPDYDEEMKAKQKKEIERCENLKLKIDEVFDEVFTHEEKISIQPHKELIFNFIRDNAKVDLVNDLQQLSKFIKIYHKVLIKKNVRLNEYVYLYSLLRNFDNEITEVILSKYEYYKNILISFAEEKYNEQKKCNDDSIDENIEINEIIDKILCNLTNGNIEDFVYNPLLEKYYNDSDQTKKIVCEKLGINSIEDFKTLREKEIDAGKNLIFIQSNTNLNLTPYLKEKTKIKQK